MRVLMLTSSNDRYGSGRVAIEDAWALTQLGHDVTVGFSEDGPLDAPIAELGATPVHLEYPVVRKARPRDVLAGWRGDRSVSHRAAEFDLVVLSNLTLAATAMLLSRRSALVVQCVQEIPSRMVLRVLGAAAKRNADAFVFNSEFCRSAFTAATSLSSTVPAAVIYPSTSSAVRRSPHRTDGATTFLVAGRFNGAKGHLAVIAAVERLRRQSEVRLVVAGSSYGAITADERSVRAASERHDWIDFAGEVGDLAELLDAVDFNVVASERETFGLTILEAWAAGRLSIAPASGGAGEAVALTAGLSYGSAEGWTQTQLEGALRTAAGDPALRGAWDPHAPARALCSREARIDRWARLIAECVEGRTRC